MKKIIFTKLAILIVTGFLCAQEKTGLKESDIFTLEQVDKLNELLKESRKSHRREKNTVLRQDEYQDSPFWETLFSFGGSFSEEQKSRLQHLGEKSEVELLSLNAIHCFENKKELEEIIREYKKDYSYGKRQNGAQYIHTRKDHLTEKMTPLWETLLLSPKIEKIGIRRIREALWVCGDIDTMAIMRIARNRLIMDGVSLRGENLQVTECWELVAATIGNWVRYIEHVDEGGEKGAREVLSIVKIVEDDYPFLNNMERFKGDERYSPEMIGVKDYIFERVLLKRGKGGEWLWEKALRKISLENVEESEGEIIKLVLSRMDEGR